MISLFIDSSRKSLSLALLDNDKLIFNSNINSNSKHSNFLMDEIKSQLNKNNISIYNIDNFIALNGPGSFTGVRVGVTIAKTFAWVLGKKLYLLNNLEALKIDANSDIVICVISDKKTYSYVGIYAEEKIEDYMQIDDNRLKEYNNRNITIVSFEENDFIVDLKNKLSINNSVKHKILNNYNYQKLIKYILTKKDINPHKAEPIYLKKIDAEK